MSMVLAGLLLFGAAAEPPPSPPVWQVDHGENFCSVIHRPRADPGQTIVYRLVPLSSTADLLYSRVNGDKGVEPPQTVRVLIEGATADTVGDRQQIPFQPNPVFRSRAFALPEVMSTARSPEAG
ncbi:hypothetical protein GGR88_001959 [Sphingomonas jejuensis]|uniref:Uncharacterized protein n=1 Tax=Sphingomonas jejuensis TaxID=904715 RepID=A0ABX0XP50_9SPHN|nr:hypothetical protein [Sphingomonas jejuensis]NJC34445.1 hypothetical protein [Sphingomonas jejuensis]